MDDLSFVAPLRSALLAADYTQDVVADLLGETAQAALARNETTPGLRRTRGESSLETMVRLWLLQSPVPVRAAHHALPDLVDRLCNLGILEQSMSEVSARVEVRPHSGELRADPPADARWILADLVPGLDGRPQHLGTDHVLGISPAATSLAELTIRRPVHSALDLGTGCGVQALHLAEHAARVVATDVNSRALWLTQVNAQLNHRPKSAPDGLRSGLRSGRPTTASANPGIEVRGGSFFEPVAGERFDLIVTNPPFVISPGTGERLVYRDSGLPGDRVVEDIVRGAPAHLNEAGTCQILANWMILRDQPWQDRLSSWCAGVDVWAVQRESVDLPTYVELWCKDAGQHPSTGKGSLGDYRQRYDTWLSWLEDQGVEAIGFGWINLRRTEARPVLRLEEWPYDVATPLGEEVAAHFERVDWLRTHPDLQDQTLVRRPDVIQETSGVPGAEDPAAIVLRQQVGMRRARQVTSAEAAFVGACDGDLTVGQLNRALSQLGGEAPDDSTVRAFVAEGFLDF